MFHGDPRVSNALWLLAQASPLLVWAAALLCRWRRPSERRAQVALLALGVVLFFGLNMLGQMLWLPMEQVIRARMCARAKDENLVGKGPEAVRAVLGEPCQIRHEYGGYIAWDYPPVPLSSWSHVEHFKVFFASGTVSRVKCSL